MACCEEDFDSDSDDEDLRKDFVAVPSHSKYEIGATPFPSKELTVQEKKVETVDSYSTTSSTGIDNQCEVQSDDVNKLFSSDLILSDSYRNKQCSDIQEAWLSHGIYFNKTCWFLLHT